MSAILQIQRAGLLGSSALVAMVAGAVLAGEAQAQSIAEGLAQASASSPQTAPTAPQTGRSSQTGAAAEDEELPELIITAERRAENLQKTSIAATVLGPDQLVDEGVDRVADLQTVAPSVAINTYSRSTFINIRGVGIAVSAPTTTPGVAYYIDGAFIAHETYIGNTFYDLASVEVLRGPQGTLTGQNSTGGAIYTRTPEPQFDAISGYVDQTIGDYGWYRTVAAINVPLSSMFAVRAAIVHETRDSFTKNRGGPNQPGNVDTNGGRVNLEFKPNDKLQVNLRFEDDVSDNGDNAVKNRYALLPTEPSGAPNPLYNPNLYQISEDARGYYREALYRSDLEAKYDVIPSLELRYLLSYQHGHVNDLVDGDRSTEPNTFSIKGWPGNFPGRLAYIYTVNNILLNEFDLISQSAGPLQFVLGAFTLDENVSTTQVNDKTGTVFLNTSAPAALGGTGPNPSYFNAINTSRSGFGQVTYSFNDQWQLIAGMRYSSDTQQFSRVGIPGFPLTGAPYVSSYSSGDPTGRVALNYNVNESTLLYATVSRGYKAGGVNLTQANPAVDLPANFLPETNTVEEFGVKTDILDHRLRINADVFTSQYDNQQLSTETNTIPANPYTTNVPRSTALGVELEVTGQFNAWQFNGGFSYLNAQTSSTVSLTDTSVFPALLRTVASGTTLPFAPEFTANLGLEYHWMVVSVPVRPRLQVSYVSDQWATPFETQGVTGINPGATNTSTLVPAHTITDFQVTAEPRKNVQIVGFVTNVFNVTYIASQLQDTSGSNGGIIYGAPRQFGVRLIYKSK
jgi:iron complex outermembrane receptor protein